MVLTKAPILAALACASSSLAWAQAPHTGASHPNLNGIWQALNEANWDLEGHGVRAAQKRANPGTARQFQTAPSTVAAR